MKYIKTICEYLVYAGLTLTTTLFPMKATASDISIGMRGPTNYQIDERITYSRNEKNTETVTNLIMPKCWYGQNIGGWGYAKIPYGNIDTPNGNNHGLRDISIGGGLRGSIYDVLGGDEHFFSYIEEKFPTGEAKGKIPLSDGSFNTKIGLWSTFIFNDKKTEIGTSFEYNITGKNNKGINPPNEFFMGTILGQEIYKGVRIAAGLTKLLKENGDYLTNFRGIIKVPFSKRGHLEVIVDDSISSKNIPKSLSITSLIRLNLGKKITQ